MFERLRRRFYSFLAVAADKSTAVRQRLKGFSAKLVRDYQFGRAILFHRLYRVQFALDAWIARHVGTSITLLLCTLIAITAYLSPAIDEPLRSYFTVDDRINWLRTLLVSLGGALIGAAAIVMSLVMFAMQINIERTPHRLFRQLSTDLKLLGAFASTFVLAFAIASLGLALSLERIALAILGSLWATLLILMLFLYAYRRALLLINPIEQLSIVAHDASRYLKAWSRRAGRAAPLFDVSRYEEGRQQLKLRTRHDIVRLTYFRANTHWTNEARIGISQAISFSRRYAEQGDYEVAAKALNTISQINMAYILAKGKTFFSNNPLFENPLTTDGFINNSLEHLRQSIRIGVSRGDEQQVEQNLATFAKLQNVYLGIDYAEDGASKTHAHLASGYLAEAVQSVFPAGMPNVLMEGIRLMGECAQSTIMRGGVEDVSALTDMIQTISANSLVKEDHWPVTLTGIEQIRNLTLLSLKSRSSGAPQVAKRTTNCAVFIAAAMTQLPQSSEVFRQSFYLAPFYSIAGQHSFLSTLAEWGNHVLAADANSADARILLRNIAEWSEELHELIQPLLLLTIEKRSQLTFDVVTWVATTSQFLLTLSTARACDQGVRDDLLESALDLAAVLSWIPRDREAVKFVEAYGVTETLFQIALEVKRYANEDQFASFRKLLLDWTFEAGRHQIGRPILERGIYALVVLATLSSNPADVLFLRHEVSERLLASNIEQEVRQRTAKRIRETARSSRGQYLHSPIESMLSQLDQTTLRPLLLEVADILFSAPLA